MKQPTTNEKHETVTVCAKCGHNQFFIFSSGGGGHATYTSECAKCGHNEEIVYIAPCEYC